MTERRLKQCTVAYAERERQYLWRIELAAEATIEEALAKARAESGNAAIPWDTAPIGIFGEPRTRLDVPAEGDRIELYRPLTADPRERRRERVRRTRRSGR